MKLPKIKKRTAAYGGAVAVTAIIVVLAVLYGGGGDGRLDETMHGHTGDENGMWTCSMHPQVLLPEPGRCPICGMDLIPVASGGGDSGGPRELRLSPEAVALARIATAPVERRPLSRNIRLYGKIAWDETGVRNVAAWFPGRIDRLYVDFTGQEVKIGDRLADMYSPSLRTTWEELKQALLLDSRSGNTTVPASRPDSRGTVEAVREKLRLLGLTDSMIRDFEKRDDPPETVPVTSTASGVVIGKNAVEGMYADTGTVLYRIADRSVVWALLDVYESDLAWIQLGDEITLKSEAYPGDAFDGSVSFIDPQLDTAARSVNVRVSVPNPDGLLRPGMFVSADVRTETPRRGQPQYPLVIPASAPLITGERAVVYVESPGEAGVFEGREIVLGHRAGDLYEVREGLSDGERVVVNGAFRIDSALQIQAKPSMMSPVGGPAQTGHDHGQAHAGTHDDQTHESMVPDTLGDNAALDTRLFAAPEAFLSQLDSVYTAYFTIHHHLSHDSLDGAKDAAGRFTTALSHVDMMLLDGDAHMAWMEKLGTMQSAAENIGTADNIEAAREKFKTLSDALIGVAHAFGTTGNVAVYSFHCPMAFDNKGSDWLQGKDDLENPWFGSAMFKCGTLEETISGNSVEDHEGHR